MKSLDQIAIEAGTDKSSLCHNYCKLYEKYLPFQRDWTIKILEIGVFNGSSLRTWKNFYQNSYVVGIDINSDCLAHECTTNNIHVEIGSQTDENFLKKVIEKHGPFDLIVDDGSHMQNDMIFSFKYLFNAIKSHGVYIVEDTCCSYWSEYQGGLHKENTIIEHLKSLVDHVNFLGRKLIYKDRNWRREDLHIEELKKDFNTNIRIDIESINFLNSTVLITKR